MPQALDITNQIFGNLKAISKAPSRSKKTYWLCECLLCGTQKEIQTSHLTSGAIKSCGCMSGNLQNANIQKKCLLCGNDFIANVYTRQYCFDCSPQGLAPADALRFKKRKLKHKLIEYKGNKCQRCGYSKCEGALQFHHKDPKLKEFQLSHINLNDTNFSFDKLLNEVDKCELLCANCHAEQHYLED